MQREIEILGILSLGGSSSDEFPGQLVLPADFLDRPQVELLPDRDAFTVLSHFPKFRFAARLSDENGTQSLTAKSNETWIDKALAIPNSDDYSCHLYMSPVGLLVDERSIPSEEMRIGQAYDLTFWISPNDLLNSSAIVGLGADNEVKVEWLHRFETSFGHMGTFYLEKSYYRLSDASAQISARRGLVARGHALGRIDAFAELEDRVFDEIDRYLMVASLGSRTRTHCLGWVAEQPMRRVTKYRANLSTPTGYSPTSKHNPLINRADLGDFLAFGYRELPRVPVAMASLIYALTPLSSKTLESDFLSLFSALEEWLLDYRRRVGLEFNLKPSEWTKLSTALRATIKASLPEASNANTRARIYTNLAQLNRVPLRDVFDHHLSELSADLSDLWPMFDSTGGCSLYQVRNWLVHGEPLSSAAEDHLSAAVDHLRWSIERIALKVIGWTGKSAVDSTFLVAHMNSAKHLATSRSSLTAAMRKQG